ncbi:hypothetical protein NKG94_52135 [Micromonospora sp. M12]
MTADPPRPRGTCLAASPGPWRVGMLIVLTALIAPAVALVPMQAVTKALAGPWNEVVPVAMTAAMVGAMWLLCAVSVVFNAVG